jgi:hypothetical protein
MPRTGPLIALIASLGLACHGGTNRAPSVSPVPAQSVTVGDSLAIDLSAVDPDGDRVIFTVAGVPEGTRISEEGPGKARFTYSPLACDAAPGGKKYDLVFTASDGRGGRTDLPVSMTVYPEASVPAFLGPFTWTLNLAVDDNVVALIRVRDDDTAALNLQLLRGIDGAVFEAVNGHTASLYWRPKPSQLDQGPVFTFEVGASDGLHPEVTAAFAIVLVNAEMFGGCPGVPPVVSFEPPGDDHGTADYALKVRATDPDGKIRRITCLWSAVEGLPETEMNRFDLSETGDGTFEGAIKNLSAAAGDGRLVRFHLVAADDDDHSSDYCDHQTRVPKTGEFAFAIYDPDAGEACLADAFDTAPAPSLPEGVTPDLRLCGGQADRFSVELAQGQGVAVSARLMSASDPLTVTVEAPDGTTLASGKGGAAALSDSGGTCHVRIEPPGTAPVTYELTTARLVEPCQADAWEPDDDPSQARDLAAGSIDAVLCPAEADHYRFHLDAGQAAEAILNFDASLADLDLALFREGQADPIRVSAGTLGAESVFIDTDAPRDFVLAVRATGVGSAPYTLDLRVEDQGVLCQDDAFAPNFTPADAPPTVEGMWDRLRLCPGRTDWLRLDLNGGEHVTAGVETDPGVPAPAIALVSADGKTVVGPGETTGSSSVAASDTTGPGAVLIRIGPAGDQAMVYDLHFGAEDPAGDCRPDRLEPNDAATEASPLAQGYTTHLTLCTGDMDVFALKLAALETVQVRVLFGSASVHLSLVDETLTPIQEGEPSSLGEDLQFLMTEKGTAYLKVTGVGSPGWYDVALETM